MARPINKLGDPVLRCPSRAVELSDQGLKEIISEMSETLRKVKGLGLAGPQVGFSKRVFVYDMGEGPEVMLNPEIVWQSEEKIEDTEGCLSIPGHDMTVTRAAKIIVEGYDQDGRLRKVEAEGLTARMFQHEIDHLNGLMIIDRTSESERREILKTMIRGDQK